MKKTVLFLTFLMTFSSLEAQNLITENFDSFPSTWTKVNTSVPAGANLWGPATAAQTTFFGGGTGAYNGNPITSFAFANFHSTTGNNTISNWLITPIINLMDGDVISFYSSKGLSGGVDVFADNLQLRISTNGATTVNPSGPTGVGDFTLLAVDINPTLSLTAYPNTWTQYTYTVTGLPIETSCKVAFRYVVPNGGPLGDNSDQVAIDQYTIDRPLAGTDDFFTANFVLYPNPTKDVLNITSKNGITIEKIQISDVNGRIVLHNNTPFSENFQINVAHLNLWCLFCKNPI